MNKKLLLTIYCLLSVCYFSNAQSWQWGKRGGSADAGLGGPDETVVDMATDRHGNVYVLSTVMQTALNVDGHGITGYGAQDILLTSFTCDGVYRWSKDLGDNNQDLAVALKTDTAEGVYVTGNLALGFNTMHISADSLWSTGATSKSIFIAKFDTSGTYKWFVMPQPDTAGISSAENTFSIDMDVDNAGNSYLLCTLSPGAYAGGAYIVSVTGYYILKYDNNGNFLSGTPMQIYYSVTESLLKIKRDQVLGNYYVTGVIPFTATLTLGGIPIKHPMFIGCFNSGGTLLWQKQDGDALAYASAFGRADIDAAHNIYLGGRCSLTDTFAGYAVVDGGSTGLPVVFKLDTNGNMIWAKNATVNGATLCSAITLTGSEVAIAGEYPGSLKWAGFTDSLSHIADEGYGIFVTRFNAITGAVLGVDSLASTFGINCNAVSMAADKLGNFYVGGDFGSSITVNGTTINSTGGGSDFFAAKYGSNNCDLAALQTPSIAEKMDGIHIYPNPATNELNITGLTEVTTYKLMTITGITVARGTMQSGANTVSLHNMATGIYMLALSGADGTRNIARVVKE